MQRFLETIWYNKQASKLAYWLLPFSWIYRIIIAIRYQLLKPVSKPDIPIIVVGNLSVGGVGKTPLVIALAHYFMKKNYRVGIVSRGYKSKVNHFPYEVTARDKAEIVGDEPWLLASRCECPVVISPKRIQAVQWLIEQHQCELIISDDGLQHYAMSRSVEIAVIDGLRYLGNGFCLPAGPLREPASRLKSVDFTVINTGKNNNHTNDLINSQWQGTYYSMLTKPQALRSLTTGQQVSINQLSYPIAAVAGIGNPKRFFQTLHALGIAHTPYVFPDHHLFTKDDLKLKEKTIIMTEKDAVKCGKLGLEQSYVLPIEVVLPDEFWQALDKTLFLKGYLLNEKTTLCNLNNPKPNRNSLR